MHLNFQLESEYPTSSDLIQALIDCKVSQILRLANKDIQQRLAKSYQYRDMDSEKSFYQCRDMDSDMDSDN